MKVGIVGAGGRVGSNTAFALQMLGCFRELVLVDVAMQDAAAGEALDLRHGTSLIGAQRIRAGDYKDVADCDVLIITAGLRRRPDESRLQLINRNVELFKQILSDLKSAGLSRDVILLVVSNPVDILTYMAAKDGHFAPQKVFGSGTYFDTTRFRSLLGEYFDVDPRLVSALILGEHGDSMVPIWSRASINGVPLKSMPGYDEAKVMDIFEQTKKGGAEVIRLKGGAGWGIALTIARLVEAIATDARVVVPISTVQDGLYGISDVSLSVPTVLGRDGVLKRVEMELASSELEALRASAKILRDTLDSLG